MNVNGIGAAYGYAARQSRPATKADRPKGFGNAVNEAANTQKGMVLHGVFGSIDEETGDKVIGAWADGRTGTSTTVFRPADFNEANPIYKVKIWDAQGNVTEREVNMNEVDVSKCDTFDMYAYSCYLSDTGQYPSATRDFMMTHAHYASEQEFGASTYKDMFSKVDWLSILSQVMQMQSRLGNWEGYLGYKGFYDFLAEN